MPNSDNDDTSDIEAAVLNRLTSWADPSDTSSASRPLGPRNAVSKRRKRKPRHEPSSVTNIEQQHDSVQDLQHSLPASVSSVAKRVLQWAIIPPPTAHIAQSVPPRRPSATPASPTTPIVVKAPHILPGRRRREGNESASAAHHSTREASRSRRIKDVDAAQFVESHRREVGRFGSQALHKRDRKSFETAQLVRLGCRPPKRQKMPIGLLIRKREKQKARDAKKKELDIASGMLIRSKRR